MPLDLLPQVSYLVMADDHSTAEETQADLLICLEFPWMPVSGESLHLPGELVAQDGKFGLLMSGCESDGMRRLLRVLCGIMVVCQSHW